jgi:hypothetical protein
LTHLARSGHLRTDIHSYILTYFLKIRFNTTLELSPIVDDKLLCQSQVIAYTPDGPRRDSIYSRDDTMLVDPLILSKATQVIVLQTSQDFSICDCLIDYLRPRPPLNLPPPDFRPDAGLFLGLFLFCLRARKASMAILSTTGFTSA